jgi:hypothetical protein
MPSTPQAALAAERERAARRGQSGAAAPEIQIREVHGGALKHMAPGQRAEADALRNAFGVDYEAKLRQEAGAWVRAWVGGVGGGVLRWAAPGAAERGLAAAMQSLCPVCRLSSLLLSLPSLSLPTAISSPTSSAPVPSLNPPAFPSPTPTPTPAAAPGPDPGKLAKRRHQISSLYHYAKQKELEQLEVRGTGVKTKAETHRKYGW